MYDMLIMRHCEERSDEAIQGVFTGLLREYPRNDAVVEPRNDEVVNPRNDAVVNPRNNAIGVNYEH